MNTLADYLTQVQAAEHGALRALAAAYGDPPLPLPEVVGRIATLTDFFKLGLAIGQELERGSSVLDSFLSIERPTEAMQFVIAGALVGHYIQDPEAILKKMEAKADDNA